MENNTVVLMEKNRANKSLTTILYALYAVGMFIGITWIAAIVINYIKKDAVQGTVYESHFRWQIRTFWFSILWAVAGFLLMFAFGLGLIILIANYIWVIYRIVKGWLNLNDNKPMYL